MEKLIKLLNKYEKEIKKSEYYEREKGIGGDTNLFRRDTRDEEGSHLYSDTADTYVISKKYGFIKWLVENDKINGDNLILEGLKNLFSGNGLLNITTYEVILMLLSTEDDPIKALIQLLK